MPHTHRHFLATMLLLLGILWPRSGSAASLDACDEAGRWRGISGQPPPEVQAVEAPSGKALHFRFAESRQPHFAGRSFVADESWDRAAGISFRFRGNGSDDFVAVSLVDETFTMRYAALIGLQSKEWRTVRLRWTDFVPEVVTADWFGAPGTAMQPSKIRGIWFGRWFYFKPWAACTFELDELALEAEIPQTEPALPDASGMQRTLAKLRAKELVTLVALGDSITYGTHIKDRARDGWPGRLQDELRKAFGYDQIHVVNKGIGGLETRQAIALLPRDVAAMKPDLVLVHFGYNDYSSLLQKRKSPEEQRAIARGNWRELVLRVRRLTEGQSEVLLIATIPGADEARRESMNFFGETAREVAAELRCAYTEAPRSAFQAARSNGTLDTLFVQLEDGKPDVAHPSESGQMLFSGALIPDFTTR
ncbi:MAG: CIA30 family protein [Planctomycetes bacterium]|nr:CIA30 family protein [Planctomycetota bacterium]